MYLTSLTTAFDPHTTYMSPSSVENFKIMMQLKLEGIGASLQGVDGYTVVKKIIPGGAAEKEGHLKLDDKIIGVGEGESGELVDVVDMKLNDVVKMIRGKPGTVVRLQVTSVKDPKPHDDQDHAGDDRIEGQRGPRRGLRGGPPRRRQALQDRRDQPAQLLHGHGRRPPGQGRIQEHDPRRAPHPARTSSRRASTPWSWTSAPTAAAR